MRSIPNRHTWAGISLLLLLFASAACQYLLPQHGVAMVLAWLALMVSSQGPAYWAKWAIASATTAVLVAPVLSGSENLTTQTIWGLIAIWTSCLIVEIYQTFRQRNINALTVALDAAPTGMMLVQQHGEVLHANTSMQKLFEELGQHLQLHGNGQRVTSIAGSSLWESLATQHRAMAAGESIDLHVELPGPEDTQRTLWCHAKLARPGVFGAALYLVQVADLTPEINSKRLLRAAGNQMRRIISSSTDPVVITDQKLCITFANDQAGLVLANNAGELLGLPIYDFVHHEQRRTLMRGMERFTRQNRNELTLPKIQLLTRDRATVSVHIVRVVEPQSTGYAFTFNTASDSFDALAQTKSTQERFSQIFHGSPDAIMVLRADDSTILDFNEGFTRLLGYHREQVIGEQETGLNMWTVPADRQIVMEQLLRQREVIDFETSLNNSQGALVHVEISLRYIEIDNELCILLIGRDITRRISAEAALYETEEKFEKVFSQSPDGIVILRQEDGVITDINEALLRRSGFTRAELVGHSVYDAPGFLPTEELQHSAAQLAHSGKLVNHAVTLHTKQGDEVASLISITILELSGEAHVMVIIKDISKLRTTEERLRRSEARFRGTFENAPIGILLVDMEARIFQANPTAAKLLAYDRDSMRGLHLSRLVPPEERRHLKENLHRLMLGQRDTHRAERRMICKDGLEIWTNQHIGVQYDGNQQPEYYIVQIADISDLKRSQAHMEQMAFYDTLTNLANRRLFQERLQHAIERCRSDQRVSALLYLDLDNFKRVNDTLGHQVGDNLLREVSARLLQCVRRTDTVGRTGGDEFTILLNDLSGPTDAGNTAQKILNHLREPITISSQPLVVTTSIGIALLPTDGLDINQLMRNADLAMYKAKEAGRNTYQFYSEELNTNAASRLRTEYDIRQALENREFELYYQPKVSLRTHQIVGAETLIRWNHPKRGMISPDEFIPVAEETGLITDIGNWVIEAACKACRQLTAAQDTPFKVAINISPRQFRDPSLVYTIKRHMREAQLDPSSIELEITETMLMQDVDAALMTIQQLSDLGVSIAIDDFGTGHSSFVYLKRFPIDTVKIDRSFVTDLPHNEEDTAITKAVIAMAHNLKMEVVAEGVETKEQLRFLAQHKCEYAQGWLFSKALPLRDLMHLQHENVALVHQKRRNPTPVDSAEST